MPESIAIFWFRRDLRFEDNTALITALEGGHPVLPIFIFDKKILDELADRTDARVAFIHGEIQKLNAHLQTQGCTLKTYYETPIEAWKRVVEEYDVKAIYANRDYEPYARERDKEVYTFLKGRNIPFISKKDHVIFEKNEVLKDDGQPYKVYTPYSRKWKGLLSKQPIKISPDPSGFDNWLKIKPSPVIPLSEMGFSAAKISIPPVGIPQEIIKNYHRDRDTPSLRGTSRLGIHLRFGTISIRQLVAKANTWNEKYLNELIWRDFYQMILWHFPYVVKGNFNKKYDAIQWRNDPEEFSRWCDGNTGYPIVDAGMRELNTTGFMHNRVRMIVASFLTKHLLIDWRWGEAYFAGKLLDYELASNNGGWQWAAGTGVDAAPYFRVFNPDAQTKKFDAKHQYIKKWVPEYQGFSYPAPMVDHKFARERALKFYKEALENQG